MSSVGVGRRVARLPLDVSHVNDPESPRFGRTQQSFKDDVDINLIMRRFERTGMIDHLNEYKGQYGDFLDVPQSFHEAMDQVIAAEGMFMTIPAKVRARFHNDPGEFLAFVSDPANADEMYELGLAKRPVADDVQPERSEPPEAGAEGEA